MSRKEIVVQIFTGGYLEKKVTYEQIEQKLRPLLETAPIGKVLMGWAVMPEVYCKTKELLAQYGTELYLWLPVFSETGLLKPIKRLLDWNGQEVKSYHLKEGENFEFYCPNQELNTDSFLEIYEENFAGIDFDGVFLDKIRFGAFSNGINGVFNCFCPKCLERYAQEEISAGELKAEMQKVLEGSLEYSLVPLGITSYENGIYHFKNKLWKRYFDLKGKEVTQAVSALIDYFHNKNMKVGLDTFSPFTAYFAGQDIKKLGQKADFIKPMMYRITQAPAGLPFEAECLMKETTKDDPVKVKKRFYKLLACEEEKDGVFDLDFVYRELESLTETGIKVYAGTEMNRIEGIAPVTPVYIRESMQKIGETQAAGIVLSWDLLSAPDENLEEVKQYGKYFGNEKYI